MSDCTVLYCTVLYCTGCTTHQHSPWLPRQSTAGCSVLTVFSETTKENLISFIIFRRKKNSCCHVSLKKQPVKTVPLVSSGQTSPREWRAPGPSSCTACPPASPASPATSPTEREDRTSSLPGWTCEEREQSAVSFSPPSQDFCRR